MAMLDPQKKKQAQQVQLVDDLDERIESNAMEGLRGLAAIHIMVHHYGYDIRYLIAGNLEIPLFYLMSGFSLALCYGKTTFAGTYFWETTSKQGILFNIRKFYQNRLARVVPLYYLSNAICMGQGSFAMTCACSYQVVFWSRLFWWRVLLTLTMTNSWLFIGWMGPANERSWFPFEERSWFIGTMMFFYLAFPFILPALQSLSTGQLSSLIVCLFHFQCLPFLLTIIGTQRALIWVATCHPITRLPVFMMGIAAGLVRLRGKDQVFNVNRNFLHDIFPWGFRQPVNEGPISAESVESKWRWRVDRNSIFLILLIVTEQVFKLRNTLQKLISLTTATVCQFTCVHMQLMVIMGLTQDGGKSIMGKIMRFSPIRSLGQISMEIYLLHRIPMCVAARLGRNTVSYETIVASVIATLILATLVNKVFTVPIRNLLKAKR